MVWVVTRNCLFSNFGMHRMCKMFTTKSDKYLFIRLSQTCLVFLLSLNLGQKCLSGRWNSRESDSCEIGEWEESATQKNWRIVIIMSRVAQHQKLFWGFLFWLNGRHCMWCRNFEKSLQTEPRRSLKTLYPDQLVVWEWSVVLTTKDLQIIKEADDGPLLRKLAISHYIHNSINKTWMFRSIESSICRKDVYDKVQRVDYERFWSSVAEL